MSLTKYHGVTIPVGIAGEHGVEIVDGISINVRAFYPDRPNVSAIEARALAALLRTAADALDAIAEEKRRERP